VIEHPSTSYGCSSSSFWEAGLGAFRFSALVSFVFFFASTLVFCLRAVWIPSF
jgi:hypothetical protein